MKQESQNILLGMRNYNAPSRYQSWKIIDFQNVKWFLAFISLYLKWFLKSSQFASQNNKAINWNSTLAIFVWFWNQYGGFVYITKKKNGWLLRHNQNGWLITSFKNGGIMSSSERGRFANLKLNYTHNFLKIH